jgi:hypothetical protein
MAQMKKPATPMARATKRGTPVAMPSKPSKTATTSKMPMKPGNIATGSKQTARPTRPGGRPKNGIPDLKSKRPLKPMTEAQKQAKAMDDLMKKRAAVAKKTGKWPNYGTN